MWLVKMELKDRNLMVEGVNILSRQRAVEDTHVVECAVKAPT
jgi:hypothetical protein